MNQIEFYKYQGCGNDFILLDNRLNNIFLSSSQIALLCHRRFGIGADGLMTIQLGEGVDFVMSYYNSDGNPSSFCGNGGRCIVQFAYDLQIFKGKQTKFLFGSDIYHAELKSENDISLHMKDVRIAQIKNNPKYTELHTGSPHYIEFSSQIDQIDFLPFAKKIRYSETYPEGINVNLVEVMASNKLYMRTYERGVEDETYSCGTGVTAAAIAYSYQSNQVGTIFVTTKGGDFEVQLERIHDVYANIRLIASAQFVFQGSIAI